MLVIIPILLNIIATIVFYLMDKRGKLGNLGFVKKQLLIGFVFGLISITGSELGWDVAGTTMNVRDSAPLCAGLIFGWPAGIIAGTMGGVFRGVSVFFTDAGRFSAVACSVSTVLAGVVAAVLRKFMFDDKKPTWVYACSITVVMEIFHMLMIFITNMDEANKAFEIVRACSLPMAVLNAFTVGISVLIVTVLSKEKIRFGKGKEQIAQTFQRWLVTCILIAFVVTSIFTYNLQSGMRKAQIQDTFRSTIDDVIKDIEEKSNDNLLAVTKAVAETYLIDTSLTANDLVSLVDFAGKITDVNFVSAEGIVQDSTDPKNLENGGYNFNNDAQPKEFMVLADAEAGTKFVQDYQPNGFGQMRKYAGITLPKTANVPANLRGGFIQVSYNDVQHRQNLDQYVIDFTKNRRVGTNGFVAVCDDQFNLITEDDYNGRHISIIGFEEKDDTKRLFSKQPADIIYETTVINPATGFEEDHLYVYSFKEEYCVICAMPTVEAMLIRDASVYLSVFMQVIIFGVLFVLLYFLIKRVVIDNIYQINSALSKISSGNLNETVDVRSNVEFASLSDDINSTVDTLKRYISEAAARIDKELEYAKQIQHSVLPHKFPEEDSYEICAQMIAAKEVGGDFYDFYKLNEENVAFLVADVSGKGIPAAMFMMTAKTIIKDLAERGLGVNEIFTIANEKLCENNESGMFVTAWMGILNTTTGKLTFANAGHNPPLLYKDGKYEYLKSRAGLVLAGMEGIRYRLNELQLNKGDKIFLYTDGVTEATDAHNELYGEDRLLTFMNGSASFTATQLLPELKGSIDEFVGDAPQFDDITMLIMEYKGTEGDKNVISKNYPASVDALPEVLGFVEQTLEGYDCSMKVSMALTVAIEEIFVNIAKYAYGGGEGEVRFDIGFDEQTRKITFETFDSGMPFNPLGRPDPDVTLSADERGIGGLGIYITKKTMDEVSYRYENGQNILTMTKII